MCKFIFPSISFKIEKWKWNEEYRVYVSTLGHFKDEHKKNMPVKINNRSGYCMINTPYGMKTAHRLVMLTFRPIPNAESLTIDHLNHNKRCNELRNLEWVTLDENRKIHNANRPKKIGGGTYEEVCQNMKRLRDAQIDVGAIQTTTRKKLCLKRL